MPLRRIFRAVGRGLRFAGLAFAAVKTGGAALALAKGAFAKKGVLAAVRHLSKGAAKKTLKKLAGLSPLGPFGVNASGGPISQRALAGLAVLAQKNKKIGKLYALLTEEFRVGGLRMSPGRQIIGFGGVSVQPDWNPVQVGVRLPHERQPTLRPEQAAEIMRFLRTR